MRTMMKKCGVFAAFAAALLVIATLVIGCPASGSDTGYQPPAGMGAVKLNFSYNARTVLPEDLALTSFLAYQIQFISAGTPGNSVTAWRTNATKADPITLEEDTYTLTVVAYLDAYSPGASPPTTETLPTEGVAVYTAPASIVIAAGDAKTFGVTLKPIDPAAETELGAFVYTITGVANIDSGTMEITSISTSGSAPSPIDIKTNPNNTASPLDLKEGYYYVDLSATSGSSTFTVRNILHIYRYMTSSFSYAIVSGQFLVTTGTEEGSDLWEHKVTDNSPVLDAGAVTITPAAGGVPASITVSKTSLATTSVAITVSNSGDGTLGTIDYNSTLEWFFESDQIGTGDTLTITNTTPTELFADARTVKDITVIGEVDGIPYSTVLRITINP